MQACTASAPLVNAIVNKDLFHSNSNIAIDAASNHSYSALLFGRPDAPDQLD